MGYFQTQKDLKLIRSFRDDVFELWKLESTAVKELHDDFYPFESARKQAAQRLVSKSPEYQDVRQRIAQIVKHTSWVARRHGVSTTVTSYPAPAVGGAVIPVEVFFSVLQDFSHGGIKRQLVVDMINQTIGACETDLQVEFRRMFNPLYWIKSLLIFLIRIPFLLISVSGFDVEKVEDHFLSRLFKLLELGIILYVLVKLGLSSQDLKETLLKLIAG